MGVTVDWAARIIHVSRDFGTLVQTNPTEVRNLDINLFRLALKDLEDDQEGAPFLDTHRHNSEVLLGGIVYARVVEIINNYTITFEDGQYSVNLLGANSNIGDKINKNQVSINSANSAGLISNQAIEFSSYNGGVTIDIDNITGRATSSVVFPAGTEQQPVNNLNSLSLILQTRGFNKVYVKGTLQVDDTASWVGIEFVGESPIKSLITIDDIADVFNCEFYDCTVEGTLDGSSQIRDSIVNNIDFVDGFVFQCALGPGDIILGTSTSANFFSCYSTIPGNITPVIDMNGTGVLALRDYNGGMELRNYNGNGSHSVDLSSGQIKLDPNSITSGTFVIRGVGKLIDASTGLPIPTGTWNNTVNVINELLNRTTISEATEYSDAIYISPSNGRVGTTDPIGLERDPVNNIADAVILANNRGVNRLFFMDDYTFTSADQIYNFEIIGDNDRRTTLTFEPGCIVGLCDFHNLILTGELTGLTGITNCVVNTLGSVGLVPSSEKLLVRDTEFMGLITIPANYSGQVTLINCYSGLSINQYPIFDFGDSTGNLVVRGWDGQIELKGLSQGNLVDVSMNSGEVELDPTHVTNAVIHITGTGLLRDESTGYEIKSGIWNYNVTVENETVGGGDSSGVWSEVEKQESLAYGKKASDNAEQSNLRLQ